MSFKRKQIEQIYKMSLLWNTVADIKRMRSVCMYCKDHQDLLSEKSKSRNNIECTNLICIYVHICIEKASGRIHTKLLSIVTVMIK